MSSKSRKVAAPSGSTSPKRSNAEIVEETSARSVQAPGALLYATVGWTGAAVMIVEIVGTRVLGPVFGVNLFVWAALLAVTLCSLAVGYYFGGILVDRNPVPRLLGVVTVSAAVVLATAVLLSRAVLALAMSLGPRVGPLASASLLFAPCLVCLGMVSPITVRLATADIRVTGHRVGHIYAVSTATGLLSTLLVSFYLIPALETNTLLLGTAVLLGCNGTLWFVGRARYVAATCTAICLASSCVTPARILPPDLRIVEGTQSPYSLLEVIDDSTRRVRLLRADHSIIGGHFTDDHGAVFTFLHLLEALRFMRPTAKSMLQIGLGTGALPMAMKPHGIVADVVELDPEVVRLAQKHFGFTTAGSVYVEDARTLLNRTTRKYDLIVHDTFTGGTAPAHLLSLEVLYRIKRLRRPGGVVALNFVGFDAGPDAEATWLVWRTLREVFPQVRMYRDSPRADGPATLGNFLFFASETSLDFDVPSTATFENETCRRRLLDFQAWRVASEPPTGPTISDARNSLARLQLPIADHHFEAMGQLLPKELWIP